MIARRDIVRGERVFCEHIFVYAPRGDNSLKSSICRLH